MTINYTTNLSLAEPVTGTESGTWGDDVNKGLTDYLDISIAGTLALTSASFTANALTLALTTGSSSSNGIIATTAQYYVLKVSSLAANVTITAPTSSKSYIVVNNDPTYTVTIKASGQTGVTVAVSSRALVVFNGTDYAQVGASAGGSNTQVQYNSSGALAGSANFTFNGTTATINTLNLTNALGATYGGTGQSSAFTQYGVTYASSTSALATTAAGTSTTVLHGNASGAPTFGAVSLTADVTGTLPIANGGTGLTTLTANNVILGNGTSAPSFVAPGTSGNVLTSNGTTWTSAAGGGGGGAQGFVTQYQGASAAPTMNSFSIALI